MKSYRFLSLLSVLLVLDIAGLRADAVTPEQATQIASQFFSNKGPRRMQSSARRTSAQSAMTTVAVFDSIDSAGQPYIYAVSAPQQDGFVLVSGDDRFNAVLGYSDGSSYDEQTMPENMRAWMQGYIAEMRYLESKGYRSAPLRSASPKAAISPLLTTKWNQGAPFNNNCPIDNSTQQRSVTGCVAAAMAQVINYHIQNHNAPTQIVAAIPGYTTYTRGMYVGGIAAGTKLPAASYLIDDYANNAGTDDQKLAVANLMLYCGVAMNMDYTSTGSGVAGSPAQALKTYFGFDSTTRRAERKNFTYQHWMNIIYDELAAGRPVYHSGATATGGHAFVIDGYDGDGLFHVNWGWGGSCDDYFALSVMNPDDNNNIGASTSNDGYTIDQQVVIGVQIGSGESYTEPVLLTMDTYNVNGQNAVFNGANFTGVTHSWTAALAIIDDDGTINQIGGTVPFNLDYGYYSTEELTVPTNTDLAGQTKRIVPVCRLNEEPQGVWHTGPSPDINYWQAVYDANGVPTLTVHPIYNLSGVISVPSNKFVNETQTIQLQVTNSADEFYGQIYLFASTTENKGAYVTQLGLISLANSTETVQFEWTPTAAGTYNLWVATSTDGSNVIATGSVTIVNDPSLTGKTLVMTACSFENTDATSAQIDASGIRSVDVYGDRLKGSVTVKNISNSQFGPLNLGVRIEKYNTSTQQYDSDPVLGYYGNFSLQAGKSVNLGIERTSLETDNTYRIRFLNCSVNPNVELEARYVFHLRTLTNYTITYDLAGGTVDPANPTSYNVLSNAIRLNNPTRTGYTFAGWTGTDLDHPAMTVTIPKGSTGNRSYTATWTPNIYVITWQMDDGSLIDTTHVAYGQMPTHADPSKEGDAQYAYTFAGWSPSLAAATANATYQATFNAVPYATITQAPAAIAGLVYDGNPHTLITAGSASGGTMQYKLNDGAWSASLPTATEAGLYTVYYKVVGDASHADRDGGSLQVRINYSITYDLGGGSAINPTSYNEETATFTLVKPTRHGYTCVGWTGTGLAGVTASVTISQGSSGNRSYTAVWIAQQAATYTKAPVAKTGLEYSGSPMDLVTAGETDEGTMMYKPGADVIWSASVPQAQDAGEYHVMFKVIGDDHHADSEPEEVVVNIAKAAVSITTAPVITNLTYTGAAQPLVTAGVVSGGTFWYRLDDGAWSSSIPTATAVGEYAISYKVVGDNNHHDSAPTGPTTMYILPAPVIKSTTVTWTTADVLRTTENGGIGYVSDIDAEGFGPKTRDGITVIPHGSGVFSPETDQQMNPTGPFMINSTGTGSLYFATTLGKFTRIEINNNWNNISNWAEWETINSTTVWTGNTDTVKLIGQGAIRSFTQIIFTIEQVDEPKLKAEVTQAPEAQICDYDGQPHTLITAGAANHGTMAYRIGTDGEWSSELPVVTQAGNYDVYYKAVSNHPYYEDSEVQGPAYASITPLPLRITAGNAFILAGSSVPDVPVTYSGFINDDTEAVLSGTLRFETDYTDAGGTYDLRPAGVTATNYAIQFVPGTLTVRGSVFKTFRINYDTYVSLSPSNLQYDLTNSTWRLAEHPWTVIGAAEGNTSESGWRDLIGWEAAMALDFGESGWRMLTGDEWKYIFEDRYNAAELSALATVHGQHGLILLPDGMETPPVNLNTSTQNFDANILTDAQWSALEYAGAVFLPTAGYRTGTETKDVVEHGYYWSTSLKDANTPYVARFFNSNYPGPHGKEYTTKSYGCSVRMIKTMPSATVTVDPAGKGDVIYTGETIELVTPGATEDGVIAYKVGYYGTWSTDIPVASEMGEYTIYYKVLGDAAHADGSERYAGQTIITKPRAVVTSAPTAVEGLIYTGEPQALVTHGTATGGTIVYSFDYNSNYSDTIPKATASGYYGVFWKAAGDADHADSGEPSLIHVYIGYGITYDLAGGTVETPNPTYYNGGMSSFTLNSPTREGYTFTGWTGTDLSEATIEVTILSYEHSGPLSYTANWEPKRYTILWQNYDGTVLETDEDVAYGTMPSYDGATPTKPADSQHTYSFAGWSPAIAVVTGDATYQATFTSTLNQYTVTWLMDDGSEIDHTLVAYGEMPTHADPTKAGDAQYTYTFSGWTPEVEAVTGAATYQATFSSTVNQYTVIWKNKDGTVVETDENVPYGTTPTYNGAALTKASDEQYRYVFAGWTPNVVAVKGDATYTATFDAIGRYSGQCGESAYWAYNAVTHTLTISGSGAMYDYETVPWVEFASEMEHAVIESGITNVGKSAFKNHSQLTTISLPTSVTQINDYAFFNCGELASVNFPEGLLFIGEFAFHNCWKLTSLNLPEGLLSIGMYAFNDCEGLTSIVLPSTLTTIGDFAFANARNVTVLDLSESLNNIGAGAFINCYELTDVTVHWTSLEGLSVEDIIFDGVTVSNVRLHIPAGTYSMYASASPWSGFDIQLINYTIVYDLDGGEVATPNPTDYNEATADFTLNNPTREGYTFTGWTGTDLSEPTVEVTVAQGSFGNRSYTANWEKNTPTAIDPITGNPLPVTEKVLIDDQIYIIRGGKVYTLQGLEVK